MKNSRHELILNIIKENKIRTHEALVDELSSRGVTVTQATVSRDIKELGIVKVPDAGNLVIIRTNPGMASAVAAAVDKEMHSEIAGSIAGDDTIFVAVETISLAHEMSQKLKTYFAS